MGRKFKADIRRDVVCEDCDTGYFYFHDVEVDEGDSSKFDDKIRKAVETGVGVAPCPRCGHMNPEIRAAHLKSLWSHLGGLALTGGLLAFGLLMLDQGALMFVLLPLAGLGMLGFAGMLVSWPFQPAANRKHSLVPGEEDQASEEARTKFAAWQAAQAAADS
ncbi:hypothetical protein [Maricaulis sp.]|uniref:hypothetical protein n=1 Tax=Maricaulis sp. TaxID=1486257 RepID=UPI003A8CB691